MKHKTLFVTITLIILFGYMATDILSLPEQEEGFAPPAGQEEEFGLFPYSGPKYAPGEILVKFKEGADPQTVLWDAGLTAEGIQRVYSTKPVVTKYRRNKMQSSRGTQTGKVNLRGSD